MLVGRDGYDYDGNRLRVEFAKGGRNDRSGPASDRRENRGRGRRSDWRVLVTHLPKGASWQDLKDFMRKAGDVIYADVDAYGDGVVEYSNEDDMEHAVRKLDDTEFRNSKDSSYVRVKFADRGRDRQRRSSSRDRARRSRSRDRSDSRDHRKKSRRSSRRKSPSPSPRRDASPIHENDRREEDLDDKKDKKPADSRDDSPPPRHRRGSSSGSDRDSGRRKDRGLSRSPSSSRERSNGR